MVGWGGWGIGPEGVAAVSPADEDSSGLAAWRGGVGVCIERWWKGGREERREEG